MARQGNQIQVSDYETNALTIRPKPPRRLKKSLSY